MSFFASQTQKIITPPSDPDARITIQKLPGRHLLAAREQSQLESIAQFRKFGGAEFQKELASIKTDDQDAATKIADPLNLYDIATLLEHGIAAWTFERPVDVEARKDLDDDDSEFIAREILRLSKPSLFVESDAAAKEAQKNVPSSLSVH